MMNDDPIARNPSFEIDNVNLALFVRGVEVGRMRTCEQNG